MIIVLNLEINTGIGIKRVTLLWNYQGVLVKVIWTNFAAS
jgi:hypothetical protein